MNDSTTNRAAHRLLTTRGALPVVVCPLCAALVLAVGLEQHARVHAAFDDRPYVCDIHAQADDHDDQDRDTGR